MKVEIRNDGNAYVALPEAEKRWTLIVNARVVGSVFWSESDGFVNWRDFGRKGWRLLEDEIRRFYLTETEILQCDGSSPIAKHDAAIRIMIMTTDSTTRAACMSFTNQERVQALNYLLQHHKYT